MTDPIAKAEAMLAKFGLLSHPNKPRLLKELADEFRGARASGTKEILEFCQANPNAYCEEVTRMFGRKRAPR